MKIRNILLFVNLAASLISGCNYLDYDESTHYEKEYIFSSFDRTKQYLTNIYSYLTGVYSISGSLGGQLRAAACDEAVYVNNLAYVYGLNNGSWSAINTIDDQYRYFTAIRSVNLFLDETKNLTFDNLRNNLDYEQIMEQFHYYPFEARFLRAFFYFELAKRYGDIPLITTVLTEEDANTLTRTPFAEVINFIVSECDILANELPVNYSAITQNETGRATRGMALALKSKALLYAASPLFNDSNDKSRWEKAARAAGEVIAKSTEFGYSLPDLANLWNKNYADNKELILGVMQTESNTFEYENFPTGIEGGGSSGHCPTQNLVDAYEMKATGLPISASAGYQSADPAYDPQDPYTGRDPRFYATIAYNNSVWVYNAPVEIWNGGRSGKPVNYASLTGYYLKKYVDGTTNLKANNVNSKRHVWNLIRYSEILLNYAEAVVEAYGDYNSVPSGLPISAKEAVDMVRARSGVEMPPFPSTLSLDDFKKKLRNERMVELAFEDQRFWDIRRWKIGASTTDIYGVNIEKTGDNTFKYTKIQVEMRIFSDKMNLYPIPQSEIYKNSNLTQNNGW